MVESAQILIRVVTVLSLVSRASATSTSTSTTGWHSCRGIPAGASSTTVAAALANRTAATQRELLAALASTVRADPLGSVFATDPPSELAMPPGSILVAGAIARSGVFIGSSMTALPALQPGGGGGGRSFTIGNVELAVANDGLFTWAQQVWLPRIHTLSGLAELELCSGALTVSQRLGRATLALLVRPSSIADGMTTTTASIRWAHFGAAAPAPVPSPFGRLDLPVYWINLDRAPERRSLMEEQFARHAVRDHTRVVALDQRLLPGRWREEGPDAGWRDHDVVEGDGEGALLWLPSWKRELVLASRRLGIVRSMAAVTLSHVAAIEAAYEAGHAFALIVEDDLGLGLLPSWSHATLSEVLDEAPDGWHVLQLVTNNPYLAADLMSVRTPYTVRFGSRPIAAPLPFITTNTHHILYRSYQTVPPLHRALTTPGYRTRVGPPIRAGAWVDGQPQELGRHGLRCEPSGDGGAAWSVHETGRSRCHPENRW
jgi:hypothetical protein